VLGSEGDEQTPPRAARGERFLSAGG
jgi:transposase